MKQRLVTALIAGGIAAVVGIGVAIWQRQSANMLWIALGTASVGFIFGFVFKFTMA